MVPVLLQFLTVLPEELYSNTKIPVTVRFRRNFTEPPAVVVNFVSPFLSRIRNMRTGARSC
jgi:hypothetical protein